MKMNLNIKTDFSKLEKFKQQLENRQVDIGILGNNQVRGTSNLTNAIIGLEHEFGSITKKIPSRSFLRMPLFDKLNMDLIKSSNITKYIMEGKLEIFLKMLGVLGENIVQTAFETSGFGKWKPLSIITILKKKSSKILIDTAQLRKSITSRIK